MGYIATTAGDEVRGLTDAVYRETVNGDLCM
jgi:hypothetical protein